MNPNPSGCAAELRDVHAPALPGFWPPAPGWWLAAADAVLVSRCLLGWRLYRRYRLRRYRRQVLAISIGILQNSGLAVQKRRVCRRNFDAAAARGADGFPHAGSLPCSALPGAVSR